MEYDRKKHMASGFDIECSLFGIQASYLEPKWVVYEELLIWRVYEKNKVDTRCKCNMYAHIEKYIFSIFINIKILVFWETQITDLM